jgi:hypothetical protein
MSLKYFEVRLSADPGTFVRKQFATDAQTLRQHARYERKIKNPASGVKWVSELKQASR